MSDNKDVRTTPPERINELIDSLGEKLNPMAEEIKSYVPISVAEINEMWEDINPGFSTISDKLSELERRISSLENNPLRSVTPIPPASITQEDVERNYADHIIDNLGEFFINPEISTECSNEQRKALAATSVDCNLVRSTNARNVGRIEGLIEYDETEKKYKHGSAYLPDFPIISGFGSICDGANSSQLHVYGVYVGFYYDSWYVIGPIDVRCLNTVQSATIYIGAIALTAGSELYTVQKEFLKGVMAPNPLPVVSKINNDFGNTYDISAVPELFRHIALQLHWSDNGHFYVVPGIAWNENYLDGEDNHYKRTYFFSKGTTNNITKYDVSANSTTAKSIYKLNYSLSKNKIYWFDDLNAANGFISSLTNANQL